MSRAQKSAYEYYQQKQQNTLWGRLFGRRSNHKTKNRRPSIALSMYERNVNTAWYALAIVIGAIGATYAAVPLYKVFCQTTGFGGTTQRVRIVDQDGNTTTGGGNAGDGVVEKVLQSVVNQLPGGRSAKVHTWTDEEAAAKLATLRPVENAHLITVRFDSTVDDVIPWSFEPVQLDVKVVPGETALSFFRVTNHSDKAITGVATYNVHPPKVGLYFQKIQCFCFEEQRLLPGETVDMPVFFFLDPEILDDPQVSYVRSVTLSYTFFQTDEDDDNDDDEDEEEEQQHKNKYKSGANQK
jgi:cytochrome c oxidase assembly protein subunit 11